MRWNLAFVCTFGFALAAATAAEARYRTIDIPGGSSVTPQAINAADDITGYYTDENDVIHGFVRLRDGTVATFDVTSEMGTLSTLPSGINGKGEVTGGYVTSGGEDFHSFARDAGGNITAFDVPGGQESTGVGIDARGTATGLYIDKAEVNHVFQRTRRGKFRSLDAPGAGHGKLQGTWPGGVSAKGDVAGYFMDDSGEYHGFVRAADGTFATFEADGAGVLENTGTLATGVNNAGDAVGYIVDNLNGLHGFVRTGDGTIATFDVPDAQATVCDGIDADGEVAGYYLDASGKTHGFLRTPDGAIQTLDAKGDVGGTTPSAISPPGDVTGTYQDADGIHGFLLRR